MSESKGGDPGTPPPVIGGAGGSGKLGRRRRAPKGLSLGGGDGLSLKPSLSMTHNVTRVLDWVVLGGREVAEEKEQLECLGVTHILNATKNIENRFPDSFQYLRVPVDDEPGEDITPYFQKASDFIQEARDSGGTCLVHCKTGMSRSSAFVLAHMLLTIPDKSLAECLAHARFRRPRTAPNGGFMEQLVGLETKLRDGVSTVDVEAYKEHRFDDVATFVIGDPPAEPVDFDSSGHARRSPVKK